MSLISNLGHLLHVKPHQPLAQKLAAAKAQLHVVRDGFEAAARPRVDLGRVAPASAGADAQFVAGLYRELLHREPDLEGFASHIRGLGAGMSRDELRNVFLTSPEYRQLPQPPVTPDVPPPAPPAPPEVPDLKPPGDPKSWTTPQWHDLLSRMIAQKGVGPSITPAALAAMKADLNALGADWQHNSAGDLRPRLFLPTGNQNDLYSRPVDLGDWNGPWQWIPR